MTLTEVVWLGEPLLLALGQWEGLTESVAVALPVPQREGEAEPEKLPLKVVVRVLLTV